MLKKKIAALIVIFVVVIASISLLFLVDFEDPEESDKLTVVTTFYPLYYFANYIAGDRAEVSMLIPDNVEPHSWSPGTKDLIKVSNADVFVYNGGGFEPWMDSFMDQLKEGVTVVDTSTGMDVLYNDSTLAQLDPHFWLDPLAAIVQAENIAEAMVQADQANATYYENNLANLTARLNQLNEDYVNGLANRTKNVIVTTHEGFDYMAMRYNFTAYGVLGISGDEQVSAQDMADLIEIVEEYDLEYVFSEPLFSDTVMEQISEETGATVIILDGIHGRSGPHADMDYFEIMYENLKSLKLGLGVTGVS